MPLCLCLPLPRGLPICVEVFPSFVWVNFVLVHSHLSFPSLLELFLLLSSVLRCLQPCSLPTLSVFLASFFVGCHAGALHTPGQTPLVEGQVRTAEHFVPFSVRFLCLFHVVFAEVWVPRGGP